MLRVASIVEDLLACKWSTALLSLLADGEKRPSQLLRCCPGLSPKVMNERLKKMVGFRLVNRFVYGEKPPIRVVYKLTPLGMRLAAIVREIEQLQSELDRGLFKPEGESADIS
ncbi:MAG: helix-turn-helix transcriptional regulator [Thermoguttaceae bacterium]|nr:helix-turn-helix transcriptional regulator [Thermoguttaceae bacterium]MDW8080098.1 helix-turn-helix domain-containing protein [Thermoguttaceae bacterium]